MASTDPSSASTGPRYAPEDPTLPKPWMGLIDGSTGFLYYWNPETNVTQYEKPASVPPPLPLGPPPTVSTPKLAQIPTVHSSQLNGLVPQTMPKSTQQQQGQQTSQLPLQAQATQQQGHENSQVSQQHGQLMPLKQGLPVTQVNQPVVQQPGSHLTHGIQQSGQPRSQMIQQPVQQMFPHMGQQVSQHGGQQFAQQPMQQMPQQSGQHMLQHQSLQMPQQQGQQYTYQHYMTYQQNMLPQDQQSSQQQFPNQSDHKTAFAKRGEIDISQGKQTNFSPSHFQQAGAPSSLNLPVAGNPVSMAQGGAHSGQPQQFNGSTVNMQPATLAQQQQSGTDLVHQQHGPRFHNHLGPLMLQNHPSNVPNTHGGGTSSDYYVSAKTERPPIMGPKQSNIPALPMSRNQQESRMDVHYQNASPAYAGGFNSTGHTMHNMYNHASGHTPFPNNAIVRPPSVGATDVTNLSPTEAYCQTHEVTATGGNVPAPYITFEATGFPPEILYDIRNAGFSAPTPIQAQTWPIALQNRDIVAIAKTGSGKTLGYLIPAFILLRQRCNNSQNGPTVLVLAPTRELATQIQDEVIKFGQSSKVSCTCLYGGTPKTNQLRDLNRGADIVVATPGRLNDILEMKKIDFRQISLLVLDEADRMLDMGFEPQIRKIVNEIPPRRQTLMYTATWPKEVRKIASDLLVNPVQVNIGNVDELSANKSITQYVEVVPQMEKECRLEQILRAQETGSKVIVFCSTKRLCDQLARSIGRQFGAAAIHGDKSQVERDSVLNQFKSGKSPILVATDVAARGLDIKDIRVVINYDFPTGVEDYVHRIGRTGRAGATGISYTFFSEQDWKYAPDLIKVLEGANQQVPPEIREMALRGGPALGKDRGGMNRFDSGGGRWESGGRGGMRDGGFGGRGGMRDGGFGGRGGMRDGNFGGRGGMRDGNFGGRGGMRDGNFGGRGGMRDGNFGGRGGIRDGGFGGHSGMRDGHFGGRGGGRNDLFSGRGNRGRGFGNHDSWGRSERGPRGRGRGRFDDRREMGNRSNSRSPDRVRTWGYSRSRSRSRSWSKSRSRSRSWSRGRSRSYSRSPRRSRSYSRSPRRSRSRSRSYERPRKSRFDEKEVSVAVSQAPESGAHDNAPSLAVESCVLSEEASAIEAVPET